MIGGPDDGADLYSENHVPCLVCGREVAIDWDGQVIWHMSPPTQGALTAISVTLQPFGSWCSGSRTSWQVPA